MGVTYLARVARRDRRALGQGGAEPRALERECSVRIAQKRASDRLSFEPATGLGRSDRFQVISA